MRVLFTSVGAWGHIHPMVPLAHAFIDRGDDVLWATSSDACPRLERDGIRTTPAGLTEAESLPLRAALLATVADLPPPDRPLHAFGKLFGGLWAPASLGAIRAAVREWEPDVLICEQGEFAGPLAAALAGVPNVCHGFGHRLPADRVERVEAEIAPLWAAHGREVAPYGGCYDHLYVDLYPASLALGGPPVDVPSQSVRPTGFATAGEELPDFVAADDPRPVVYVTLGTVFNPTGALGVAVDAAQDLPVRVVVTVGPYGDPAVFGDRPENVHVARYISQGDLLPHCAAVVSHAGSGTFLGAMAAGLPQVCLPQGADQFLNAAAGAKSGAAISLSPDEQTVVAVRAAIERALSDGGMRSAARDVAEDIAAMPAPEEVATRLADRFG